MEMTIETWLDLIRAEFREMPGMQLTRAQAQRLWGLDSVRCDALLAALTDARFLKRTEQGAYTRADLNQ
jgi:hypothetical protein